MTADAAAIPDAEIMDVVVTVDVAVTTDGELPCLAAETAVPVSSGSSV